MARSTVLIHNALLRSKHGYCRDNGLYRTAARRADEREGDRSVDDRRRIGEDPDNGGRTSKPARLAAERAVRARQAAADDDDDASADTARERRQRRAQFLAELAEARELRKRVAPRRTRAAELHERVLRTFRY